MEGADFGDKRLSNRLLKMVEQILKAPDKSFPSLFDEAELEAAYRFFSNDAVTPERILDPHRQATLKRMDDEGIALVIHDTTTMAFDPDGMRSGLGRNRSKGQAFFAHASLAVAADGSRRPLGALELMGFTRNDDKTTNERDRWLEKMDDVEGHVQKHAKRTSVIHLADREADDFQILTALSSQASRFVIRMKHNRRLSANTASGAQWLRQAAESECKVQARRSVHLSARPAEGRSPVQRKVHPTRSEREAHLNIGATTVLIERPGSQRAEYPEAAMLNVVRVWEPNPPSDQEPVEWLLLTTEPVGTEEDILRIVDWYRSRWVIEEFFKALKTGCSYEKRQITTYQGLMNVLATFMPVAYHLLLLRSVSRDNSQIPAAAVLSPTQLRVLAVEPRAALPACPTARDAFLSIARLGGHLKRNGEPGWIVLSRGYETLLTLTAGWRLARSEKM